MASVIRPVRSVSLACDHAPLREFLGAYLRYLEPGLKNLAARPLRLVFKVVRPEEVPAIPELAEAVPRHANYRVATLDREVFYESVRGASVRVAPSASKATIWMGSDVHSDERFLRELVSVALLELARHRGFYGIHTAAVTKDGGGCLLPGPSGSGKTSLSLALVRDAGFRYVTDDFVLLTGTTHELRCVPFFRTFNLDPMWAEHYPELSFIRQLPPLENGKRAINPERLYERSRARECRPAFIVFPRVVAAPTSTVRSIPKTEAFRRLLRESPLSPDREVARRHLQTLQALVRQSATYEYLHGADFLREPGRTIENLIQSMYASREVGADGRLR